MHDNERVTFTAKELLVEVRDDVKAISTKLDLKADRSRFHELSNALTEANLKRAGLERTLEYVRAAVDDHGHRLDVVERVWDRVAGGLKVAAASFGLFSGLVIALFAYLISTGPK